MRRRCMDVHELDVVDRMCPSCGGELSEWAGQFEESREVDMYERRFVQLHHKRKKYRCGCGGRIETVPAPSKLMKGGRYSIDIAISIASPNMRITCHWSGWPRRGAGKAW